MMHHTKLKTKNNRSGFSLIELIVYFAIFAIGASLGALVFQFAVEGKASMSRMSEVHGNAQRAMQQMADRVRVAQGIVDASSTLRLAMADGEKDPTIFSVSEGVLYIQEGAGSAEAVTAETVYISDLLFTLITNPSPSTSTVQIVMTTAIRESDGVKEGTEYTLQTTAMPLR